MSFPAISLAAEDSDLSSYLLGPEDIVKIVVYGEKELSGPYSIDNKGYVSFPLINELGLAGLNVRQAEQLIEKKLSEGYLVDPDVSLEVVHYRPFYILGEVRMPGRYDYASQMTVTKAVAMAGGLTYRANKKEVYIKRQPEDADLRKVSYETKVMPGDIITVKERFF